MWTADVAVLAPLPGPYTYRVPAHLRERLQIGTRVWVPFSQQQLEGVVLAQGPDPSPDGAAPPAELEVPRQLREILQVIDSPPLPADLLALARFIADYYLVPMGEALRLVLPPGVEARGAQHLRVTEAGVALAARLSGALLPPEAAALPGPAQGALQVADRLQRAGGRRALTLAGLARQLPEGLVRSPAELRRAVQRLVAAGLLEQDEAVQAGAAPKQEPWLRAAPQPAQGNPDLADLARAPGRRALLERLREGGPQRQSDLLRERPAARGPLNKLIEAGLVLREQREVSRDVLSGRWQALLAAQTESRPEQAAPLQLTEAQGQALAALLAALGDYGAFLLHGVTGSGKTEVYLQLIAEVLRQGRTALVLVPEIGLTPQLAARFRARFGDDVAVLHSGLSPGERADSWRALARGSLRIALGPRSALFAPLARLGVIIIDEEHDGSFKQQDGVRYQGRDVALVRARAAGALAVLGSATPSLEAMAMVRAGKLRYLSLPERATGRALPQVELIDLKQHILPAEALIAAPLWAALGQVLEAREQAILFLNRRGYATFLLCRSCGHRFECAHCAVTLTWHKGRDHLLCHYCGYAESLPRSCPRCTSDRIDRLGIGTERIEEQISARFPTARVARLDRDTATVDGLARVLSGMHRREIDILVGTQMLAKGHDFPGVTLVGVVLADTGIGLPDFRAAERTFQLLAQVAGRAGRADRPGRVLIQTYNPRHPALICACTHDYARFADGELRAREDLWYPPYSRLCALRLDGEDPAEVRAAAEGVGEALRKVAARSPREARVSVLGPAEAPLSRLKGKTRWQLFVRGTTPTALRVVLREAQRCPVDKRWRGVRMTIDVDPVSTL